MLKPVIFDGKKFCQKREIAILKQLQNTSFKPKLTAILVGDNPEARLYLKLKEKKALFLGIDFEFKEFKADNPWAIIDFIKTKNQEPHNLGIIVELPLPLELAKSDWREKIIEAIEPKLDVDCLTKENLALLEKGKPLFFPPTVKAIIEILLEATKVKNLKALKNKNICVVGDRGMVGKPLVWVFKNSGLEVSGVNTSTLDLNLLTKKADILISTTGKSRIIKKEMVKEGVVVIDVGIEKQKDGSLIGDVDFDQVKAKTSFITPVPGGVGPLTIICLMENLVQSMYY